MIDKIMWENNEKVWNCEQSELEVDGFTLFRKCMSFHPHSSIHSVDFETYGEIGGKYSEKYINGG